MASPSRRKSKSTGGYRFSFFFFFLSIIPSILQESLPQECHIHPGPQFPSFVKQGTRQTFRSPEVPVEKEETKRLALPPLC